jgi:hypothetical protein
VVSPILQPNLKRLNAQLLKADFSDNLEVGQNNIHDEIERQVDMCESE